MKTTASRPASLLLLCVTLGLMACGDRVHSAPPAYYTLANLKDAQAAARTLHQPLAWVDGNLNALTMTDPPHNSEDELTQMAMGHLKSKAIVIFLGADTNLAELSPVVRDQQLFQFDDGPLPGGHHFYVPKIAFTDADVTKALGRVSYTQMEASRDDAIATALQDIANDPAARTLLGMPPQGPSAADGATTPADGDLYALRTPYKTETQWIIGSVCRNAYELLSFIADKKGEVVTPDEVSVEPVRDKAATYEVTLKARAGTVTAILTWPGSIWSPDAYVPFCKAAMTALRLAPPHGNPGGQGNPLATLLDFTEQSIQAENLRVSTWLTAEPDNALAQQQAALILGTLAMKENSGWFFDARGTCNHVTAHLAVARTLAPSTDLTVEGKMAECEVGLICDTKKECANELDELEKTADAPKELAAWVRAGRMRNSRDWRLLDKPESASGFEQVEYFRAVGEAVNIDLALRWLKEKSIPPRQDWTRLVLQAGYSVEDGQIYALPAVKTELALMRSTFPDRFQQDTLVADLNEAPGDVLGTNAAGAQNLRIIDSGMWAQFFQRHLCHALVETGVLLGVKWGVPEQTAQFDHAVDATFSGLSHYPFLRHVNSVLRNTPEHPRAILAAVVQHPE